MIPDPQWYALVTRYRLEKTVAAQLRQKGFDVFWPAIPQVHQWSDREKKIEVPLFPGYVFVHIPYPMRERIQVLRTPGVVRFVGMGLAAAIIPSKQIEDLQQLLSSHVPCSLHAFLKQGQRVRIRGGCLDRMEGILEQSDEKKLIISIQCIQRAIAIEISGYSVELI